MAKFKANFTKIETYEIEAGSPDEAITKLNDLVTFNYDEAEYFIVTKKKEIFLVRTKRKVNN